MRRKTTPQLQEIIKRQSRAMPLQASDMDLSGHPIMQAESHLERNKLLVERFLDRSMLSEEPPIENEPEDPRRYLEDYDQDLCELNANTQFYFPEQNLPGVGNTELITMRTFIDSLGLSEKEHYLFCKQLLAIELLQKSEPFNSTSFAKVMLQQQAQRGSLLERNFALQVKNGLLVDCPPQKVERFVQQLRIPVDASLSSLRKSPPEVRFDDILGYDFREPLILNDQTGGQLERLQATQARLAENGMASERCFTEAHLKIFRDHYCDLKAKKRSHHWFCRRSAATKALFIGLEKAVSNEARFTAVEVYLLNKKNKDRDAYKILMEYFRHLFVREDMAKATTFKI